MVIKDLITITRTVRHIAVSHQGNPECVLHLQPHDFDFMGPM